MDNQLNTIDNNSNIIIMDEIPPYDLVDYDLFNPKQFEKYVKDGERVVRSSFEYQEFIQYLRNYMDMNKCTFFKNVSNSNTSKIKIHLHHHPFTLYDIFITVYNKRCANQESTEVELTAKEVMYIHYFLYVGLVPLAETAHELVHNQLLFVPLNVVLGKFEEFIEMYEKYIPVEAMDRYNVYQDMTAHYNEIVNTSILQSTPVYLKLPGSSDGDLGTYGLPQFAELAKDIKDRLETIGKTKKVKGVIVDTTYDNNSHKELIKPFTIMVD